MELQSNYEITPTPGSRGFQYENKMAALIALRLYNRPGEFYLASNCKKAGKFDDIVFSAEVGGKSQSFFIQLKHKVEKKITLGNLKGKGHDFSLLQYFQSYKDVAKTFASSQTDPLFDNKFSLAHFILFTNAEFHAEVTCRGYGTQSIDFLSTNPSSEFNIKLSRDRDGDLIEKFASDYFSGEFLNQLMICTQQCSNDDIDELILTELEKASTVSRKDLELLSHRWVKYVHQWAPSGVYLTRNDVRNQLTLLTPDSFSVDRKTSVKFSDSFLAFFEKQLVKGDVNIVTSNGVDNMSMCLAALQQLGLLTEPNICLPIGSLGLKTVDEVEKTWGNTAKQMTMVLDCDGELLDFAPMKIIDCLKDLKKLNSKNTIIFVAKSENIVVKTLQPILGVKERKFNCTLKDLSIETKQMLLGKQVVFQGYETVLQTIMPKSKVLEDVYTMALMTQMILGKPVHVGVEPLSDVPYYVTRMLTRHDGIEEDFLKKLHFKGGFLAISGLPYTQAVTRFPDTKIYNVNTVLSLASAGIPTNEKILFYIEDEQEFNRIINTVHLPVHWFEKVKGNIYQWVTSSREADNLTKLVSRKYWHYVPTDNIMCLKEKIVVVTAEPGMGKSTLLSHIAADTKSRCPHIWVVRVTLNDYIEVFDTNDFLRNIEEKTKQLISIAAGIHEGSKFIIRLFDHCYSTSGNMVVLLDGFDEIVPYFTNQGLGLIQALAKSAVSRIWITGRPVVREILEKACETIAYTIKPFTEKDQAHFFRKFWHQPGVETAKLEQFISQLQELIRCSFDESAEHFTGIPLQTLMIAQVFNEKWQQFLQTGQTAFMKKINLVELFQEFINIKWKIYEEKAKVSGNAISRMEQKRCHEEWQLRMMKYALLAILLEDDYIALEPSLTPVEKQNLKKIVLDGNERTGMVVSFTGELPQFVHRTFAEYFLAMFLQRSIDLKAVRAFIDKSLFLPTFEFVRYVLNFLVSGHLPLHRAVLDQDAEAVEEALTEVNERDPCGRTALHLAASIVNSEAIIRQLLNAGADSNATDTLLSWRPFDYATRIEAKANIMALMEENSSHETLPFELFSVSWESLRLALAGDNLQLFLHLIENNIRDVECFEDLSTQAWISDKPENKLTIGHVAAAYDSEKILNHLLDACSNKKMFLEAQNVDLDTPLLVAASRGNARAMELLLLNGANVNVKGKKGLNFIQLLLDGKHLEAFQIAFMFALKNSRNLMKDVVASLVADKSDWSYTNLMLILNVDPSIIGLTSSVPFLSLASRKGNVPAMKLLVDKGADVNISNPTGTPLHFAVIGKQKESLEFLLAQPKVFLNAVDSEGATPIYRAVAKGYHDIFQILCDRGASLHCVTNNGNNLGHAVAQSANLLIFNSLRFIDFNTPNNEGKTAFDLLKESKLVNAKKILESLSSGVPVDLIIQESNVESSKCQVTPSIQPKKKTRKPKKSKVVNKIADRGQANETMQVFSNLLTKTDEDIGLALKLLNDFNLGKKGPKKGNKKNNKTQNQQQGSNVQPKPLMNVVTFNNNTKPRRQDSHEPHQNQQSGHGGRGKPHQNQQPGHGGKSKPHQNPQPGHGNNGKPHQHHQPGHGGKGTAQQNPQSGPGSNGKQHQNSHPGPGGNGKQHQNQQPGQGGNGKQHQNQQSGPGGNAKQHQNQRSGPGGNAKQHQNSHPGGNHKQHQNSHPGRNAKQHQNAKSAQGGKGK